MQPIFILDRLKVRPGALQTCRALFQERYLPGALERGMQLAGSWTTPPLELPDSETELLLLWSLPALDAFWNMRGRASADPEVPAFWEDVDMLVSQRERSFLAAEDLA
jgi:hypothetical protein